MKIHPIRGRALLAVLLCACAPALSAATYHVAPGGVDSAARDGLSPASAWASLPYAATRAGSGTAANPHVIRLAAGTFSQAGGAAPGSHVIIEGAGVGQTVINANWTNTATQFATNTSGTRLLRFVGTTGNTVRNLTLRGNSRQAAGAVWIESASTITLSGLALESFGSSAVVLGPSTSFVTLRDSSLNESGYESTQFSLGALQIYQTQDLLVSNVTFRSTLSGTGYGVKASPSGFSGSAYLRRAVFDRLDIRLKERQAYLNQNQPNFSFEFWNVAQSDNILRNSRLANTLSQSSPTQQAASGATMRIHDNVFELLDSAYAIETKTPRLEIDHNYIRGGYAVFSDWTAGNHNIDGLHIHHNVAERVQKWFFNYEGGPTNLRLHHNTVYFATTGFTDHVFLNNSRANNAPAAAGVDLRNNLLVAPAATPGLLYRGNGHPNPSGFTVARNLVSNVGLSIPGVNTADNPVGDPGLALVGPRPDWYYQIVSRLSPAADAGANLGYAYDGAAPDIGAFERLPVLFRQAESRDVGAGTTVSSGGGVTFAGNCDPGESLRFPGISLDGSATRLRMRFARGGASSAWAELRAGSASGTVLARINSTDTGGWNTFIERSATVSGRFTGTTDLYLVFGGAPGFGNIDWFELTNEPLVLEAELFNTGVGVSNSNGSTIGSTDDGDSITFTGLDLRGGFNRLSLRYASGASTTNTSHRVEVRLGSPSGSLITTIQTPGTGGFDTYVTKEFEITLPSVSATETICFVFKGGFGVGNFDWFTFERSTVAFIAATLSFDSVSLAWTDIARDETGYLVEISGDGGTTWSPLATLPADTTAYTASSLPSGSTQLFRLSIAYLDSQSPAGLDRATLPALSPIESWRLAYHGTILSEGSAADLADPDEDGLRNLLEYALGTDPRATSDGPDRAPRVSTIAIGGDVFMQLTYRRCALQPDLVYTVLASTDLQFWTVLENSAQSFTVSDRDNFEEVTARDLIPLSSTGARFMRLVVTLTA